MRFAFYTLGCKTNQFETAAMERIAGEQGHTLVPFDADADVYVVNTCTVTGTGGKKSRAAVRQAKKHPSAVVAVCGCHARMAPDELAALGVDLIFGVGDHADLIVRAARLAQARQSGSPESPFPQSSTPVPAAPEAFEALPAGGVDGRTRALLKVEDGCDNFCTYCIIPYARGRVRSLSIHDATAQLKALRSEGYLETVLTGIELSSFGRDTGETLQALLVSLLEACPDMRLRLGSLEPRTITEEFCRTLAGYPNLCPHFHLALQSGCDATLKRMNRRYDTARFARSVSLLRACFPGCAIACDLITGFPGETEEEFSATLEFIRACDFADMHIFPYSRRAGTAADRMSGHLPRAVKEDRAAQAARVAEESRARYLENQVGCVLSVLPERREEGGALIGHTENYCLCRIEKGGEKGVPIPVHIKDVLPGGILSGKAVSD